MDQTTARRRAKELYGVAVLARKSPVTDAWIIGGWKTKASTWIVVDTYPNPTEVLAED